MPWMVDDPGVLKVGCGLVLGEHHCKNVGGHVLGRAVHHSDLLFSHGLADEMIPNVDVLVYA